MIRQVQTTVYTRVRGEGMNQLDLLCLLEKHYDLLADYELDKKDLNKAYKKDNKDKEQRKLEKSLEKRINKKQALEEKMTKTEKLLKEYEFLAKETGDKLYGGEISDISQLEALKEESDNIAKIINENETYLIEYMEDIEKIEEKLQEEKSQLNEIIKEFEIFKSDYTKKEEELNKYINKENKEIQNKEVDIDEDTLKKYKAIRKTNKTAIAYMENGTCKGCNMNIATYLVEKVKEADDVYYCENCGRILCLEKA